MDEPKRPKGLLWVFMSMATADLFDRGYKEPVTAHRYADCPSLRRKREPFKEGTHYAGRWVTLIGDPIPANDRRRSTRWFGRQFSTRAEGKLCPVCETRYLKGGE